MVSHKQVEHYRSPVYDRVKRGDLSLLMVPTQPVVICGDVMVEFFNKPKMLAKVRSLFRVLFPGALSQWRCQGVWGEASPLWVDVQKLCNMCVLSLSWNYSYHTTNTLQ